MPSLEIKSVSGFRSSILLTLTSGWVRKTCGSFWNMAATATSGTLLVTASKVCSEFALMKKSSLPAISSDAVVVVGAAGHDGDVEAVFLVGAVGDRLEEAAMLALGDPVGAERDLVQSLSALRPRCEALRQRRRARARKASG